MKWADSCIYLSVERKVFRTFVTLVGRNRRKLRWSANDVIGKIEFSFEGCVIDIIQKLCSPILIYGIGV